MTCGAGFAQQIAELLQPLAAEVTQLPPVRQLDRVVEPRQ